MKKCTQGIRLNDAPINVSNEIVTEDAMNDARKANFLGSKLQKEVDTSTVREFMFKEMNDMKEAIMSETKEALDDHINIVNAKLDRHMNEVNARLDRHMDDIKKLIQASSNSSKQPCEDDGFNAFPILQLSELDRFDELMLDDDASEQLVITTFAFLIK